MDNFELACSFAARGWYVFPCREKPETVKGELKKEKSPLTPHGKDDASRDEAQISTWWKRWPNALVGIYCQKSGFFAVDIDNKNGKRGSDTWNEFVSKYGEGRPPSIGPMQRTPSGGYHLLFRYPNDLDIPNNSGKLGEGLDLRSNGYICSGGPYEWVEDHGPDSFLSDAPDWLYELIHNSQPAQIPATKEVFLTVASAYPQGPGDNANYWLQKALNKAAPGNRNDTGYWLACQLRDNGVSESEAENTMLNYAHKVPGEGYTEQEALASCKQAFKDDPREPAKSQKVRGPKNGNGNHRSAQAEANSSDAVMQEPPDDLPMESGELVTSDRAGERLHLTDMGNARRFALQHQARVCYTKAWGWMVWSGKRWELDETGQVMRLAKQTVKQLYQEAEQALGVARAAVRAIEAAADVEDMDTAAATQQKATGAQGLAKTLLSWAIKSQNRARLEAMLALAQSEPEIAARVDDFDTDPWLLNVQNGVLDLRTCKLKPHDPSLKITKISEASYFPDATCPTWLNFLERIFNGDREMIGFLQRAAGYSLTGDVRESVLFFLYGTGANGKSTFTSTLQSILGNYSIKIRAETLMIKKSETIPEEIAQLKGTRFMLASELAEGQRLNESLIKDLTGFTDKIRARLLFKDSFEFYPTAKTWMYGNHNPTIRGTDEGIWRRVKRIPFDVRIPPEEQDKTLPQKLQAELSGILAWVVRGCAEWQNGGLNPPAAVIASTAQFRADQDTLAAFLLECCLINKLASVTSGELYAAYKKWAEEASLTPLNKIAFSRSLEERGWTTKGPDGKPVRDGRGRAVYSGLGLLQEDPQGA